MTAAPDVSIVLACYLEEPHLEASVLEIIETMKRSVWSAELIFVDDCSPDRTRSVIERVIATHGSRMPMRAIYHEKNTGRGRAVSDGMREARGRWVGFLDVDLEVHCRYIPALVRALEEGGEVAIARRVYHVKLTPWFLVRHFLSSGYRRLCNGVLGLRGIDTEAGFKFFDGRKLPALLDACRDPGWFWDTEIVALAHCAGLRIVQVPCLFLRRDDKKSTLKVTSAAIDYLRKLWSLRSRLCPPANP